MSSVLSDEKIVFMDIAGNNDKGFRELTSRWLPKSLQVLHDGEKLGEISKKLDISGHKVWAIVKNPFQRAVDVWREHYSELLHAGNKYFPVGESFTKAYFLIRQGDLHQVSLGSGLKPGYIKQTLFLDSNGVDDISLSLMRAETLVEDWKTFINTLEEENFLFLPNTSLDEIGNQEKLKTDKITKSSDWKSYYEDPKIVELIVDMYADDFVAYGYSTDINSYS